MIETLFYSLKENEYVTAEFLVNAFKKPIDFIQQELDHLYEKNKIQKTNDNPPNYYLKGNPQTKLEFVDERVYSHFTKIGIQRCIQHLDPKMSSILNSINLDSFVDYLFSISFLKTPSSLRI